MEQYVVLHMTKFKSIGGISPHLDRGYIQHNVDEKNTHLNEEHSKWKDVELKEAISRRIEEGYKKETAIRKDAIRAVGIILGGSHRRMKEIERDQELFKKWVDANRKFACKEFGEDNIVRFSVHRDEKTPHIHCVFVPITKDGGLSAKAYMNGKEYLEEYQNRYGKAMEEFGLSRGLSEKVTQAVHTPNSVYYRETEELIRAAAKQTAEIKLSNILSLEKVKESVQWEIVRSYRTALDDRRKAEQHERTYKNIIAEDIKQDLEQVKMEVNLVKHLASMGYTLDKKKSCQKYAVMERDGDKLIVRTEPKEDTKHWVYMSAVNEQDRGTIVDLMLNRGYTFKDIRGLKSGHLDETVWKQACSEKKEYIADKEVQEKLALKDLSSVRAASKRDNYLEKRGIDASTYSTYEGDSMKVGRQAMFGLYQDLNHNEDGRLCSTISYYFDKSGKSRPHFHGGLPRGVAVLKDNNSSDERIIITESPIDALSHKQLYGGNATYICTCGNLTAQIKEELKSVAEGAKLNNREIVLSFDNDEAGRRMSSQLAGIFQTCGVIAKSIQPSTAKDWNEELMEEDDIKKKKNLGRGRSMSMGL